MNISLTAQLAQVVNDHVASGRYSSASEVVREALRLLVERDELRQLRRERLKVEIARGMADLDAGQVHDFDDDLVEAIRQRGRRERANRGE